MARVIGVRQLRETIKRLPSDEPRVTPGKWYLTQKQHWLGWLAEYSGRGYYGRLPSSRRDAQFAYNHIVEVKMLLWLAGAAGVKATILAKARNAQGRAKSLAAKSGAFRTVVPWPLIETRLFPAPAMTVGGLRKKIARLPADKPLPRAGIWYTTQKQHWLGWLEQYHGPGAYGRKTSTRRDARFAYNHINHAKMLLWLAKAAGLPAGLLTEARRAERGAETKSAKAGAVRKVLPWDRVARAL